MPHLHEDLHTRERAGKVEVGQPVLDGVPGHLSVALKQHAAPSGRLQPTIRHAASSHVQVHHTQSACYKHGERCRDKRQATRGSAFEAGKL
eukprot:363384-Chlamydomonas_euryale.AAC.15